MSNKPKRWLPLPGAAFTEWDRYCARWIQNGINCLRKKNNSKHQGSKRGYVMYSEMRAVSQDL